MRVLLALLAVVGLLLSPVAASAATSVCVHHHDAMEMAAAMDASGAPAADQGMPCCDDDGGKPVQQHDKQTCAQACALMCVVSVALPETAAEPVHSVSHARVTPAAPSPFDAHAPPGLKRPPKQQA